MSRVVLDSDDEDNSGDEAFDTSPESPAAKEGQEQESTDASIEHQPAAKRSAPADIFDVESPKPKRSRRSLQEDEQVENTANASEQPSSTIMDSATPRMPSSLHYANVAPEHQLGNGDITFNEDDFGEQTHYATPLSLAKDNTSWNQTTMSKATIVLPRVKHHAINNKLNQKDREVSPDELSSEVHVFSKQDRKKTAAGRSMSLGLESETKPAKETPRSRSSKKGRSASSDAAVRAHCESLTDMGFRASQAETALLATGGDFAQALDHLCGDTSAEVIEDKDANNFEDDTGIETEREASMKPSEDSVSVASQPTEPSPKKRKTAKKQQQQRTSKRRQKSAKAQAHKDAEEETEEQYEQLDDEQDYETPKTIRASKRGRGRPKKQTVVAEEDDSLGVAGTGEASTAMGSNAKASDADQDKAKQISRRGRRGRSIQAEVLQKETEIKHEVNEEAEEDEEKDTKAANEGPEAKTFKETVEPDAEVEPTERTTLGERDSNAAAPAKTPSGEEAQGAKLMLENLVRTTPRLRLASGPLHRVGLSRRRPIQSLLRTIRK